VSSSRIVDTNILELRTEGKSLREIASALGISHEAVRKRLNNLEGTGKQVSTFANNGKLTVTASGNDGVSTWSKPYESRVFEKSKDAVNQVSTEKTPSQIVCDDVNRAETLPEQRRKDTDRVSERVSGAEDLMGAIKELLRGMGVELYRMQVACEAYQAKHNGQIIRFYVQRNTLERPKVPRGGLAVGKVKEEMG
jgi:biotin operon repressor